VKTCHRRGAHAVGGMAAFIPSRKNAEINEKAVAQVRADKRREVSDGFEGTWVAHPDLVPVAMQVFAEYLGDKPHQKDRLREEVSVAAQDLLNAEIPNSAITETGFRNNVNVGLQYLNAWLAGNGAAAIHNLMEDVATAEISRSQLWQWIWKRAKLDDGRAITAELYQKIRDEELANLGGIGNGKLKPAAEILDKLVLNEDFVEFLTLEAYSHLD
jgi:malate synthase